MNSQKHYPPRDYQVARLLLRLREKAGFTQEVLARQVGVSEKAVRNWEGGSNYPTVAHVEKLLALYLDRQAFTPGQEAEEARDFWEQVMRASAHRHLPFDAAWFARLLHERRPTSQEERLALVPQPEVHRPRAQRTEEGWSQPSLFPAQRSSRLLLGDWGQALDVPVLVGREGELAQLASWLLNDRCRLVALLGLGGIGKTVLSIKLAHQVRPHFDLVLWRSLHNAPLLEDLLSDCIQLLSPRPAVAENLDQSVALLIELLQQQRCLLILDNMESVLQPQTLGGHFRPGYEGYALLLQRVAQTTHPSCVVLTCRELFPDLSLLAGQHTPVRLLKLGNLSLPATQELLRERGLFGTTQVWADLVRRYSGNPLALKLVAEPVRELFGGDIAAFLQEELATFSGVRTFLEQQFERLSAMEQAVLYWLAIEREFLALDDLATDLRQTVSKRVLVEALQTLRYRCLVERSERGASFGLQPVVLEYVTERLVEQMSQELSESRLGLLLQYGLLNAQAKEEVRKSQKRLLLQPVLNRLLEHFQTSERLQQHLRGLVKQLRKIPVGQQGYGGGNLLNLLIGLTGQVNGQDFSQLRVWHANLQEAEAVGTNFAGADLTGSVFKEPFEVIVSVAFSRDGQYLATGSITGHIHLWHVKDGTLCFTMRGHTRLVWQVAFSPDSRLLASSSYDGSVQVWDVASGRRLHTLAGHRQWVRSLAFHPEGRVLVTCSDEGLINVWDSQEGTCLHTFPQQQEAVWSVAYSPQGVLASGDRGGKIKIWDVATGREKRTLLHSSGSAVTAVVFSPDDQVIVTGGEDGRIKVWEPESGQCLTSLDEHREMIRSLACSATGMLASADHGGQLKIWELGVQGAGIHSRWSLQAASGQIWSVAWGPEEVLASGSQDGLLQVWQLNRGEERVESLRLQRGCLGHISAVAFSPDDRHLLSGEQSGLIRVWEISSGQCLRTLSGHRGTVNSVVFSPDGRLVASGADDQTIKLWDSTSGVCLHTLRGHQADVWLVAFSPNGAVLASSSVDLAVKLWEVQSGRCMQTFQGHTHWPWPVAFSPDGTLLASGSFNGEVKLWDRTSGVCLRTWLAPGPIVDLKFSLDGSALLGSGEEGIIHWELSGDHRQVVVHEQALGRWLGSAAFSQDGRVLVSVGQDQTVQIWEVSSGQLLSTLAGYEGFWSVAISPDGNLLAGGTDEGAILVWERQRGTCLKVLQGDRPYERMNIRGVTGISDAQRAALKALGAFER